MHGDIVAVGPARVLGGLCGGGEAGTGGEETEGGGLAEEVAGAGGEDEGGEDVGGGGGEGAVGEGGHLGFGGGGRWDLLWCWIMLVQDEMWKLRLRL